MSSCERQTIRLGIFFLIFCLLVLLLVRSSVRSFVLSYPFVHSFVDAAENGPFKLVPPSSGEFVCSTIFGVELRGAKLARRLLAVPSEKSNTCKVMSGISGKTAYLIYGERLEDGRSSASHAHLPASGLHD